MLTKRLPLILSAATLALLTAASLAHAQSPLGIGTAEPSFQPTGGPLAPLLLYVNYEQQAFYRALTGALKAVATRMTIDAEVSAAKPWIGFSLMILWPIVLMIR